MLPNKSLSYVDRREKERIRRARRISMREKLGKSMNCCPNAKQIEYMRWQNTGLRFRKTTFNLAAPANCRAIVNTLDQRWKDYVEFLDIYRRRKENLKSINRRRVRS